MIELGFPLIVAGTLIAQLCPCGRPAVRDREPRAGVTIAADVVRRSRPSDPIPADMLELLARI